jgi:hypothetical protein
MPKPAFKRLRLHRIVAGIAGDKYIAKKRNQGGRRPNFAGFFVG